MTGRRTACRVQGNGVPIKHGQAVARVCFVSQSTSSLISFMAWNISIFFVFVSLLYVFDVLIDYVIFNVVIVFLICRSRQTKIKTDKDANRKISLQ